MYAYMKRNIIYYTSRLLPYDITLVHGLNQFVDEFFTVTERTTLDKVLELSWDTPTTRWVGQLEWPQEVVSLLEVWTDSDDFMDQIVNGQDTVPVSYTHLDVYKRQESRILCAPKSQETNLSKPKPNPPCGTLPFCRRDVYHSRSAVFMERLRISCRRES